MPAYGYSADDLRRMDETGIDPHCEVMPDDLRPGQRVVVSFGIVTIRGIKIDGDRVTLYWMEDQPAVTQCRWNTVTLAG